MAQPINNWAEFRTVLRQLKDSKIKEKFSTIIIDTADIAYSYCEKYICANAPRSKEQGGGFGVDNISDIPFGKGYAMVGQEFDECLRSIVQMDYGLVLISHAEDKPFKDEQGQEYNKIVPTLDKRARNIVSRMADIIGYSRAVTETLKSGEQKTVTKLFMRGTTRYMAGSRFKYTPDFIDFTYNNLVNAIKDAIDKQMAEDGEEYFTDERTNLYKDTAIELDFDSLMEEFNLIVNGLIEKYDDNEFKVKNEYVIKEKYIKDNNVFKQDWQPRVIQITDKYLGRGQKVSQCSREQVEALSLIVDDLRDLVNQNRE